MSVLKLLCMRWSPLWTISTLTHSLTDRVSSWEVQDSWNIAINCCNTCSPLYWGSCQDNPDKILQSVFHKIEGRLGPTRPPSQIWLSGLSSCLSPLSQPWKTFNRHKQLQLQSWISFFLLTPWSSLEEKWTPLAPQWVLNLCTSIIFGLYLYFLAYWFYISLAMIGWFIFSIIIYVLFWVYLVLFAIFGLYLFALGLVWYN